MRHFKDVDENDINACVPVLEDDDIRQKSEIDFKLFARQMDIIMPDPAALPYLADPKFLGKVNHGTRNLYRDSQLDLPGVGEKVRALIDEHICAPGQTPRYPLLTCRIPILRRRSRNTNLTVPRHLRSNTPSSTTST